MLVYMIALFCSNSSLQYGNHRHLYKQSFGFEVYYFILDLGDLSH